MSVMGSGGNLACVALNPATLTPPWLPCHSPLKEEKDFHVRGLKITCDKAYDPKTFICLCVSGGDFS